MAKQWTLITSFNLITKAISLVKSIQNLFNAIPATSNWRTTKPLSITVNTGTVCVIITGLLCYWQTSGMHMKCKYANNERITGMKCKNITFSVAGTCSRPTFTCPLNDNLKIKSKQKKSISISFLIFSPGQSIFIESDG